MIEAQMNQARDLIKAKRYSEARALLQTIDHPAAHDWLAKLDTIAPVSAPVASVPQYAEPYAEPSLSFASGTSGGGSYQAPMNVAPEPYAPAPVFAEEPSSNSILLLPFSLIGGVIGALIGAAIWVAVAYFLDYEHSAIAIGVGFLAGGGVALFAGRKPNILHYLMAPLAALLGIGLGKYISYYLISTKFVYEDMGEAFDVNLALADYPPLDPDIMEIVINTVRRSADVIDLVFVGVAIFAAISIVSSRGKGAK